LSSIIDRFVAFGHQLYGEERGWKMKYAEGLGISDKQLSNILGERSPIGPSIREKLRELDCDITWLETGKKTVGVMEPVAQYLVREYPVAGRVKAGKGVLTFEYDRTEPGPPGYNKKDGWWFVIVGDSMQPKYEPGEMVFVSREVKPENNGYGIVVWNDFNEGVAKKIEYQDDVIILKSVNPNYQTSVVRKKEISFLGKILFTKHQ